MSTPSIMTTLALALWLHACEIVRDVSQSFPYKELFAYLRSTLKQSDLPDLEGTLSVSWRSIHWFRWADSQVRSLHAEPEQKGSDYSRYVHQNSSEMLAFLFF